MTTDNNMSEIRIADRPRIKNVARYMFKRYSDDEMKVFCTSCNRVLAKTKRQLGSHFDGCTRIPSAPSGMTAFSCGPCNVTAVKSFNERGKYSHVSTDGHRNKCRTYDKDLFSYTCQFCKMLIYGTVTMISEHMHAEHKNSSIDFEVKIKFLVIMNMVYRNRKHSSSAQPSDTLIHICNGCSSLSHRFPIHADGICVWDKESVSEMFYCASCRVTFVCTEAMYVWHLSSVEHVTLLAETDAARTSTGAGSWNVPRMVRRHFGLKNTSVASSVCSACESSVRTDDRSLLKHSEACTGRRRIAAVQRSPLLSTAVGYEEYYCLVCSETTDDVDSWTRHVYSHPHLRAMTRIPESRDSVHYECLHCNTLFFGVCDDRGIMVHEECVDGAPPCQKPRLIAVADLMRYVYDELNGSTGRGADAPTFFYRQSTGTFGRCDRDAVPASVPYFCTTCRLEFYGDWTAYGQHSVTVEHLLLRRFGPFEPTAEDPLPAPGAGTDSKPDSIEDNEVDEAYGRYIAARLKKVCDPSLKINIKLAIDALFNLD